MPVNCLFIIAGRGGIDEPAPLGTGAVRVINDGSELTGGSLTLVASRRIPCEVEALRVSGAALAEREKPSAMGAGSCNNTMAVRARGADFDAI